MLYTDKWLGKLGGGFSVAVVGGFSAYQANLWNMAGGNVPMPVIVTGARLGAVANTDAGHAIILVTGVKGPDSFTEIKSSGVDWALNIGGKADAVVKSSGKAASALWKAASSAGNWAAQESAKKGVQALMGDFNAAASTPSFIILPSPMAVGIGAGIFYEWQTLSKLGSDVAWKYVKPMWRLKSEQGGLRLMVDPIPEKDNQRIAIHLHKKVFGSDDILLFKSRSGAHPSSTLFGIVKNGRLHDQNGNEGINLSAHPIAGVTEIGMLSTTRKTTSFAGQKIYISVNVARALSDTNLYKWQSKDYASVTVDASEKMVSSSDLSFKS